MATRDLIWSNKLGRLEKAKTDAVFERSKGNPAGAHSILLSIYVTLLSGDPIEGKHPIRFGLAAFFHAFCLLAYRESLDHNQLNVLVSFWIRVRKRFPHLPGPSLVRLVDREIWKINEALAGRGSKVKPHQEALAYLHRAEVECLKGSHADWVSDSVRRATSFEEDIRAEKDQPQGLCQLVRVYRKAGEILGSRKVGDRYTALTHLKKALSLAERLGDDGKDQVPKIQAAIDRLSVGY